MSFTFGSVGDIISVTLLAKELVTALGEAQGSSTEYQSTIRELQSLGHTLLELDALAKACEGSKDYSSLAQTAKLEALKCRVLINSFQSKMSKYSESLRIGGSGSISKDVYWKLHWRMSHKQCVDEFRYGMRSHTEALTALLVTANM
jgi:hypothetical protein